MNKKEETTPVFFTLLKRMVMKPCIETKGLFFLVVRACPFEVLGHTIHQ